MIQRSLSLLLLGVAACSNAYAGPPPDLGEGVRVALAAVTLGQDCGPRAEAPAPVQKAARERVAGDRGARAKMKRACEQTSMQLVVDAEAAASPSAVHIKHVELRDSTGKKLGELTPRAPRVWGDSGTYGAWDERVRPGQKLAVTYDLTAPPWNEIEDRYSRTYTLVVLVGVGGAFQAVQHEVRLSAPTILPPNVKT